MLKSDFAIVYIRPVAHACRYTLDDSAMLEHDNFDTLRRKHAEVLFDELFRQYGEYDFNRLQLMLHAKCDHVISVLGGNAVIASYFQVSMLCMLRRIMRQSIAQSTASCVAILQCILSKQLFTG